MTKTIKAIVRHDGAWYTAECVEIDVFTQGRTLDEVVENIKKAVAVHLEGEDLEQFGLAPEPSILVMLEVDVDRVAA
jgi:predicted RNase H-like HicB family nuclease